MCFSQDSESRQRVEGRYKCMVGSAHHLALSELHWYEICDRLLYLRKYRID